MRRHTLKRYLALLMLSASILIVVHIASRTDNPGGHIVSRFASAFLSSDSVNGEAYRDDGKELDSAGDGEREEVIGAAKGGLERETQLFREFKIFHYDASNKYKVVPFYVVGPNWSKMESEPVCLATQASVDRMQSLVQTLATWGGPASVTLFAPGQDAQIAKHLIRKFRDCNPEAFNRTSFHIVFPADRPPSETGVEDEGGCSRTPKELFGKLISLRTPEMQKWRLNILYPQNLLRNTARDRCPSTWILTADVDMLPPPSLVKRLGEFLTTKGDSKWAYVLPVYEVVQPNGTLDTGWGASGALPDTKEDLMRLKDKGLARPFHITVFKPNQAASQLDKWEKLTSNGSNEISAAYAVENPPFWYEPVYVAQHNVPQYDERFVGYGMTRNTQAYEMVLSGRKFKVLDNAFLVHWGFQGKRPQWRTEQTNKNYAFFQDWVLQKSFQYDLDPENFVNKFASNQKKRKIKVMHSSEKNSTIK